jgi:hypothetical protein
MIQTRYRSDYPGEFVLLESRFVNGEKREQREWIANPIENHHISGRAAVVGSRTDVPQFPFTKLARHHGGLLGKKKLQTYGSNDLWQDMKFDFVIAIESENVEAINTAGYNQENIVYSTARNCIKHAGKFYLVPFSPVLDELSLAVYMAAFDGHQEVFLLGYNNDTPVVDKNWTAYVNHVLQAYAATDFILVGTASNMPAAWRQNRNVRTMKYREFVSYCDV